MTSFDVDVALQAMARARDEQTANNVLRLNSERFPRDVEALRSAYLRRVAELRNSDASLEQDVWASMELACRVQGVKFKPDSQNPQQMPAMIRKHGPVEALRRTIIGQGDKGTRFFQRSVLAGNLAFTSEAICLRHSDLFDEKTKKAAKERLSRYPSIPS
ncbi:hypothetical protein [Falsiroseomonas sp. E2-1-a4]|uniref:hypothetical protein n=1 Tax=Falsiroseomonas sp. E2-1-a4 TaxID=3239299 RepID=UPI003F32C42F